MFNVKVSEQLFNENIPSLGIKELNTPAYLCPAGVQRMAKEFKKFPKQYKINIESLKKQNDPCKTGINFLEREYNLIKI